MITPSKKLPEMMLRSDSAGPPMTTFVEVRMLTPLPLPKAASPLALVPMRLPLTVTLLHSAVRCRHLHCQKSHCVRNLSCQWLRWSRSRECHRTCCPGCHACSVQANDIALNGDRAVPIARYPYTASKLDENDIAFVGIDGPERGRLHPPPR